MRRLHGLIGVLRRLLAFGRRGRLQDDIDDELAFHLEMRRREHARDGLADADAARVARRQFGNVAALREETRDMWTFPSFDSFVQDVRFALRTLVKAPGFTAVVVLVLAVGIGANTAIFSLVDAMLVRGLPYPSPERLVLLIGNVQREAVERRGGSYPDFEDWREQSASFAGIAAYAGIAATVATGEGDPARVPGEAVSASYFSLLDVAPAMGRTFRPDEDEAPGRAAVAVIGHALWQDQFSSDLDVVGRTFRLNGDPHEVVGVMPPGFAGVGDNARLWIPFVNAYSADRLDSRGTRWLNALGRLDDGVTLEQAQTELDAIASRLEAAYPDTNEARGVEISPLSVETFGDLRPAVLALMGAVSFVLLIACANVANLLIGRSEARQREIAVRTALGAGRGRLLRQLVTESCVLALAGAAGGIVLARIAVDALVASSPVEFPSFVEPGLNLQVLAFTVGVAMACGVALGLAPVLHTRMARLGAALKDSSRGSTGGGSRRVRASLVVAEVALAVVLVVGAVLMIRTVSNLAAVDPGFDTESLLTLNLAIPVAPLPASEVAATAQAPGARPPLAVPPRELLDRLLAVPGVVSAALSSDRPLQGGGSAVFYAAEGHQATEAETRPRAYYHRVTPGFFETMGIPIVQGRTFLESELRPDFSSVIVSENVARRFWPGEDAVGRRISLGSTTLSIVGVVGETLYRSMPANPTADPDLFIPYAETGVQSVILRTAVPPASVVPTVRDVVRQASPDIVVFQVDPIDALVAAQTAQSRFTTWLMGLFAGVALLLAVIGIYGVMSYLVAQRTREFGIRLALGAGRRQILGVVVGSGARLVAVGLVLGTAAAFGLSRLIEAQLFGVSAADPSGLAAVGLLALVAMVACSVPALRATRVDPIVALRDE